MNKSKPTNRRRLIFSLIIISVLVLSACGGAAGRKTADDVKVIIQFSEI